MSAVYCISLLTCLPAWPLVGYCGREEASQLTTCLLFLLLFFLSFSLAAAGRRRRRLCLGFAFSLTMHGAEREEESFFVLWKAFRGEGRETKRKGSYWRITCMGSLVILFSTITFGTFSCMLIMRHSCSFFPVSLQQLSLIPRVKLYHV